MTSGIATISYDRLIASTDLRKKFDLFLNLLLERNRQMNLTAIREEDAVREKHFADSLAVTLWDKWTEYTQGKKILDLGTGGGFPGLPIKIACPDTDITMLDSVRKKLGFIGDVIEEMELSGARTFWSRAEDAGRDEDHRAAYDLVVSRAVAYLPSLIECAVPFLKEGGYFIAYKQAENEQEITDSKEALNALNAEIEQIIPYDIAGDANGSRNLVIIRKTGPTPQRYPRRAGKPMKDPIH